MGDPFRELPVRALGYGFAVGEAIIYVGRLRYVDICYTIGSGFIIVHVLHATITGSLGSPPVSFIKSLLFEGFASALIPTFIVYWACRFTWRILTDLDVRPWWVRRWGPTLIGVLVMPFIMQPIDDFVDSVIDPLF